MKLIYQIGTNLYFFVVWVFALWNPKAKLVIEGRKKAIEQLKSFSANGEVYWFHCASLGEFEQARPLIEAIKLKNEKSQIVITFFSPSGYEIRKNYELADLVLYLPKDSKSNAILVLNSIKPTAIFFVKYEFWANYLLEASKREIPTYLVSGVFRKKQVFFKWYGGYMRKVLNSFNGIYLQNTNSKTLLDSINVQSVVTGDTRFDRVMQNSENVKKFPKIENFIENNKCIVVGSCWGEDETVIFPILNKSTDLKIIIAPHEIDEAHIKSIEAGLTKKSIRFSKLNISISVSDFEVLIIDNIGMLMHLYQYADVAYVGGAFGKGLHNILEPASFGNPVIFGSKYSKFPEAYDFLKAEIGFSIQNNSEFEDVFNKLIEVDNSSKVLTYMNSQKGATARIISDIF
jgi:3-deoxy-D-manno-octulosonic-acid transferase